MPDPKAPSGEPGYLWVDRDPSGTFTLPPDRAAVLARVQAAFTSVPAPPAGPGPLAARSDHVAAAVVS